MDGDDAAFAVRARGGGEREGGDRGQKEDDEGPKPAGGGWQGGDSAKVVGHRRREATLSEAFGEEKIKEEVGGLDWRGGGASEGLNFHNFL